RPLAELEPTHGAAAGLAGPGTLAWLHGCDLFLPWRDRACCGANERSGLAPLALPPALPLTVFLGVEDKTQLQRLPAANLLPPVTVPPMTFRARHVRWCEHLGGSAARPPLADAVA